VVGGYGVSVVVETLMNLSPDKYQTSPSVAIYGIDFYSLTLALFLETRSIAKIVAIGDSSGMIYDSNGLNLSRFVSTLLPLLKDNRWFKLFHQKNKIPKIDTKYGVQMIDTEYRVQTLDTEYVVLFPIPEQGKGKGYKITSNNLFLQDRIKEFFNNIPSFDILCLCGIDSRYQLSEQTVDCMLQHHKPNAVISTIDSAFGEVKHHPFELSRLVKDDRGLLKLIEQNIQVVHDTISTIAINQLYQLSCNKATVHKMNESEILRACVVPIQSYFKK
jgi:hypothetical protein